MLIQLRRYAPLLATLLLALFTTQTQDLFLCADEANEVAHGHTPHTTTSGDLAGPLKHPTPCDEPGDGGSSALPDCLCHVVFTHMVALPTLAGAPSEASSVSLPVPSDPSSVEPDPLDHVPLA